MEPEFILFKRFDDVVLANALTEVLAANGIPYTMEESAPFFDPGSGIVSLTNSIL